MTVKLLCIGDIHLGKRPTRLPPDRLGQDLMEALTPRAALGRAVAAAREHEVDAVLFAGDVVEQADDFYEAYGDLHAALEQLEHHRIRSLAVAGNHDTQVLPRLAESLDSLQLLGAGGSWATARVDGSAGSHCLVAGWSFPQPQVTANPLQAGLGDALAGAAGSGRAVVGLLHCDKGQQRSHYAPVPEADLRSAPVDAWFLGHVHKADALSGPRPIGYLGVLSPADPGEPGTHGPWLATVHGPGRVDVEQLPLAPLRYENLTLEVPPEEDETSLEGLLPAAIQRLHESIATPVNHALAVVCRIRVVASHLSTTQLEAGLRGADPTELRLQLGGTIYLVDRVTLAGTSPGASLEDLARGDDPAGLLARKLLALREDPEGLEAQALLERLTPRLAQQGRRPAFLAQGLEPLTPDATRALVERAGLRALEALLAQRET